MHVQKCLEMFIQVNCYHILCCSEEIPLCKLPEEVSQMRPTFLAPYFRGVKSVKCCLGVLVKSERFHAN